MENYIVTKIKNESKNSKDIIYRDLDIENIKIHVIFSASLADKFTISKVIIEGIEEIFKNKNKDNKVIVIKKNKKNNEIKDSDKMDIVKNNLLAANIMELKKDDDLTYYISSGFALIIIGNRILSVEVRANVNRTIATPVNENTIKGPKDAFNENYAVNIGLIKKRIKTSDLIVDEMIIGKQSKTRVGILHISSIAKKEYLNKIKTKLESIDIDNILDSNYLVEILNENNKKTIFPTIISTERPDVVSMHLSNGRIVIVVENSPFALVLPAFLTDYFKNADDYYMKNSSILFTRLIRYASFIISIFLPAMYIALITFNQEAIPTELLMSFVAQRSTVVAPAFIECFIMVVAFELLREGDYRVVNAAGSTLSIVGALILGDAAVSAGVVSPIMIIVVAIATISGLIFSDINMVNAVRNWRVIFLISATFGGLIGIFITLLIFITKIVSIDENEYIYTYPFSPVNITSLSDDTISRKNTGKLKYRLKLLTDNIRKQVTKK